MTELQALVKFILGSAENYAWDNAASGILNSMELEGPNEAAINVFYRFPAGSNPTTEASRKRIFYFEIHTHEVGFRSTIVAGQIRQQRYVPAPTPESGDLYVWQRSDGKSGRIRLIPGPMEVYNPGDSYEITAQEIHRIEAEQGTVTVVTRRRTTPEPAGVYSFFPDGVPRQDQMYGFLSAAAIREATSAALQCMEEEAR